MQDSLSEITPEADETAVADNIPSPMPSPQTYNIISGLLWQDRKILLLTYWILAIPQMLDLIGLNLISLSIFSLIIIERGTQLIFLTWLTNRWLKILSRGKKSVRTLDALKFLAIGYLTWGILLFPFLAQILVESPEIKFLALVLLFPFFILLNKYFFYFMPALCGIKPNKELFLSATSINYQDKIMSLRSVAAPIGLFSLMISIVMAFSPDGRLLAVNIFAAFAPSLYWLLHCYISLGFALCFWSDKDWRSSGLDPYRQARLTTIALSGSQYLAKLLSPKRGLSALFISLLIWSANMIRLETTPPAPQITLISSEVDNDIVTVKLELSDKDYDFRGFQAANFNLAGEQRAIVSDKLQSAKSSGEDALYEMPGNGVKRELTLTFHTTRSGEALTKLEDLYLWYRHTKIIKIHLVQTPTLQ